MNNWRLLLLALVALVQPIASFTERNLVDGRPQCCDRQTDSLLRDSRSSLNGIQHFNKDNILLRNLNDRNEVREDRRYELRQRDTVFARRSNERSLEDIRERDTRRNIVQSTRVAYRPERHSIDEVKRSDRFTINIQDIKPEEQSRRILNCMTRNSLTHDNTRTNELSSRYTLSRDDSRISRFSNERQARYERERLSTRSSDLRKLISTRASRDNLRRTREDVARVDFSNDNGQSIAQEQVNVESRTASRADVRRYMDDNNERREHERHAGQRRSLPDNSKVVRRVRDIRLRENSRDERRENRDRFSASRRVNTERSEERHLQRDNTIDRVRDMHLQENSRAEWRDNLDRISVNRRLTTDSSEERRLQADSIKEVRDSCLRENSKAVRLENHDHISSTRRLTMERTEDRRLQTDDVVERVREMRLRENSRTERPENRDRINATRRLTTERSEEKRFLTEVDRVRDMRLREKFRTERPENRNRNSATRRLTTERSEERRLLTDVVERVREMRLRENSRTKRPENRDRISATRQLTTERSQQRCLLKDDIVERVRDMRLRVNSQTERRENRDRISATRRLTTERPEKRRQQRDNVVKRVRDMRLRENFRSERPENRNRNSATRRLPTERSEESRLLTDDVVERVREMWLRENSRTERPENRDRISPTRQLTTERSQQRRLLKDDIVERVRDMRLRVNSQTERQENRDRISATRRLTTERPEERRQQRDYVVERVRDMRPRENSHVEMRENRNRISATRRLVTLRSEERRPQADNQRQSRGQIRKNTDRRLSRERMQMYQRDIRESRLMSDVDIRLDRAVESRRDIRYDERLSRAARDYKMVPARGYESKDSRKMLSIDRDNQMSDSRARSLDLRNLRDTSIDLRVTRAAEIVRSDDASRRHVEYRNKMDTKERDTIDSRFENIELAKNREMLNNNDKITKAATNWQYILYTLQGAYLSDLLVQMLIPNCSKKSKMITTRQRLQEAGLKGYKARKKPLLSDNNKKARYTWALKYQHYTEEDYSNIVWSDESNFEASQLVALCISETYQGGLKDDYWITLILIITSQLVEIFIQYYIRGK